MKILKNFYLNFEKNIPKKAVFGLEYLVFRNKFRIVRYRSRSQSTSKENSNKISFGEYFIQYKAQWVDGQGRRNLEQKIVNHWINDRFF